MKATDTLLDTIDVILARYINRQENVISLDLIQKDHPDIQQILKLFWLNQFTIGSLMDIVRSLMIVFGDRQQIILNNQKKIIKIQQKKIRLMRKNKKKIRRS